MKDLLLCVHVVVKTLNLEFHVVIWQTTSKNCTKCVAHVQHDYFSPFNQSHHCFLSFPSSLLKLRNGKGEMWPAPRGFSSPQLRQPPTFVLQLAHVLPLFVPAARICFAQGHYDWLILLVPVFLWLVKGFFLKPTLTELIEFSYLPQIRRSLKYSFVFVASQFQSSGLWSLCQ